MNYPVCIVFAVQSVMLGAYFPRLPDVMAALALSELSLGLCLMAAPIGTLIGFATAAPIVGRLGLRRASMWAGALCVMTILLPAFAPTAVLFFITLVIFGISQMIAMVKATSASMR